MATCRERDGSRQAKGGREGGGAAIGRARRGGEPLSVAGGFASSALLTPCSYLRKRNGPRRGFLWMPVLLAMASFVYLRFCRRGGTKPPYALGLSRRGSGWACLSDRLPRSGFAFVIIARCDHVTAPSSPGEYRLGGGIPRVPAEMK